MTRSHTNKQFVFNLWRSYNSIGLHLSCLADFPRWGRLEGGQFWKNGPKLHENYKTNISATNQWGTWEGMGLGIFSPVPPLTVDASNLLILKVKSQLKYIWNISRKAVWAYNLHIMEINNNWKYSQWIIIAAYQHLFIGFLKYLPSQLPTIFGKSSQLLTRSLSYSRQQKQKGREYVLLC